MKTVYLVYASAVVSSAWTEREDARARVIEKAKAKDLKHEWRPGFYANHESLFVWRGGRLEDSYYSIETMPVDVKGD